MEYYFKKDHERLKEALHDCNILRICLYCQYRFLGIYDWKYYLDDHLIQESTVEAHCTACLGIISSLLNGNYCRLINDLILKETKNKNPKLTFQTSLPSSQLIRDEIIVAKLCYHGFILNSNSYVPLKDVVKKLLENLHLLLLKNAPENLVNVESKFVNFKDKSLILYREVLVLY